MNIFLTSIWELDRQWLLAVNGSWGGGWDIFWWTVSQVWCWIPLYVVIIWLMYQKFGWRRTLVALGVVLVGLALADQTANFFKTHTPKLRPTHNPLISDMVHTVKGYKGGWYGTVSGHAATSMAIALTSAGIYRNRWFSLAVGVYVALTCFSRMYLGVHFPLDITFGLLAGTVIGTLMLWIWRLINKKWGPERRQRFQQGGHSEPE